MPRVDSSESHAGSLLYEFNPVATNIKAAPAGRTIAPYAVQKWPLSFPFVGFCTSRSWICAAST